MKTPHRSNDVAWPTDEHDCVPINETSRLLDSNCDRGTLRSSNSSSLSLPITLVSLCFIGLCVTALRLGLSPLYDSSNVLLQDTLDVPSPDVVPLVSVQLDPTLTFTVLNCVDLFYSEGADESLDRPGYLRAASSMQWITDNRLAVVQDDSNFVALVDIELGRLENTEPPALVMKDSFSVALPANHGLRQFSKGRGNKSMKLDLEASIYVPKEWSPLDEGFFLGFGSGSSPYRNVIILVRDSILLSSTSVEADFQHVNASYWEAYCGHGATNAISSPLVAFYAPELYQSMRDHTEFSGSELNIEGAAFIPSTSLEPLSKIRFFQRGNGAADPKRGLAPKSSTAEVLAHDLFRYMDALLVADGQTPFFFGDESFSGGSLSPPKLVDVIEYNLGIVDGVALTFTGSAPSTNDLSAQKEFVYIAGAEASPDATRDGAVVGTAMGFVRPSDVWNDDTHDVLAVYNFLTYPNGTKFYHKTEGVTVPFGTGIYGDKSKSGTALTVLDMDDPNVPSQMCVIQIQ